MTFQYFVAVIVSIILGMIAEYILTDGEGSWKIYLLSFFIFLGIIASIFGFGANAKELEMTVIYISATSALLLGIVLVYRKFKKT
jgi:hypothetical protein